MKNCQFFLLNVFVFLSLIYPQAAEARKKRPAPTFTSLEQNIRYILASQRLDKSRHSIKIVQLPEGKTLYEKNADLILNPASNAKIVTQAVALKELGTDFTFKTEFYSDTKINSKGEIHHLWIKGYGDPVFVTEELESVVDQLKVAGLKTITGNIYLDDTYFDAYNLTTYLSDVDERTYTIVTGPLSFNFNSIEVHARPGRRMGDQPIITLEPPTNYLSLKNEARTGGRSRRINLEADIGKGDQESIILRGSIPKTIRRYTFRKGILDPSTYTGTVIMEALSKGGVKFEGSLKNEAVPSKNWLLVTHSSPPLREVLHGMGKFSNNFIAEQVLKVIGAESGGPPGSTEKGIHAMREYLISLGIPATSFVLDNGSGLSKLTRMSASQVIEVLKDVYRSPWRDDFIGSLSIGGVDGTLRRRMKRSFLKGKVFAKTGTLNEASCLSGYVSHSKKQVAFSFLFNDFNVSHDRITRAETEILEAVMKGLK